MILTYINYELYLQHHTVYVISLEWLINYVPGYDQGPKGNLPWGLRTQLYVGLGYITHIQYACMHGWLCTYTCNSYNNADNLAHTDIWAKRTYGFVSVYVQLFATVASHMPLLVCLHDPQCNHFLSL